MTSEINTTAPFPPWLKALMTAAWCMVAASGVLSITRGDRLIGWSVLVFGVITASAWAASNPMIGKSNLYKGSIAIASVVMIASSGAQIYFSTSS